MSVIEGDAGVLVEITNTDDVSAVSIEVGISKTVATLTSVNAVVLVNLGELTMAIGRVEAGVIVNMIVDLFVVETAVGVCGSIFLIGTIIFENKVGASTAVTLTDDSFVVEDDIGDSVAVTNND